MTKDLFVQIVIAVVGVFVVGTIAGRSFYNQKISTALVTNNQDRYKKLILSPWALILLQPHRTRLLRAMVYLDESDFANAKKELERINLLFLKDKEALLYINAMSGCAINTDDAKMYEYVKKVIWDVARKQKKDLSDMLEEHDINKKLYFEFDSSVIPTLINKISKLKGEEKGASQINLARAYHKNDQDDEAVRVLHDARRNLKDTPYADLIDEMLKDLNLLN